MPWLWAYGIFLGFRFFAFLFFAIVNDLIFAYNIMMTILWIMIIAVSLYGWLLIYSLYLELSDLTKLEDLAHLRVRLNLKFYYLCINKYFICFLKDGNNAIFECINSSFTCWITANYTTFNGVYHANIFNSLNFSYC